jgi:hypothetical protein
MRGKLELTAVFRIRIRIGSIFDGRLDPEPDPEGLKRAKMKRKTQPKD